MNDIKTYNNLSINTYGTIGSLMNGYLDSYLNEDEIKIINEKNRYSKQKTRRF